MKDEVIEKLLKVINPFVMGSLEEIVPFDENNEEKMQEVMKVALRTMEVATIITGKVYDQNHINHEMLTSLVNHVDAGELEKASEILN